MGRVMRPGAALLLSTWDGDWLSSLAVIRGRFTVGSQAIRIMHYKWGMVTMHAGEKAPTRAGGVSLCFPDRTAATRLHRFSDGLRSHGTPSVHQPPRSRRGDLILTVKEMPIAEMLLCKSWESGARKSARRSLPRTA